MHLYFKKGTKGLRYFIFLLKWNIFYVLGLTPVSNYLVDYLPTWAPTWYVSFQVKPEYTVNKWTNLVRFTAGTTPNKRLGDSIPSVFFIPKTTILLI